MALSDIQILIWKMQTTLRQSAFSIHLLFYPEFQLLLLNIFMFNL